MINGICEDFDDAMALPIEEVKVERPKSIQQIIDETVATMCDKYCRYPIEAGHEDDPDWLFSDFSPCHECPLNNL